MGKYVAQYLVEDTKLPDFQMAANKHGRLLKIFQYVPVESPALTAKLNGPKREFHYVGGVRNKGISSEQLVIDSLLNSPKPLSSAEMASIFVNRGFAGGSAGSTLSKLKQSGRIRRSVIDHLWSLAPAQREQDNGR